MDEADPAATRHTPRAAPGHAPMGIGRPRPVGREPEPLPTSPAADAILNAAEELFATHGFERTTIKAIARAANVNSALLYYYFGDKTGLYRTVLTRLILSLRQQARFSGPADDDVPGMIDRIVRAQQQMFTRHPRAAILLFRELIDHNAAHAQSMIQEIAAELFRPACLAIEQGKRNGSIRADVDAPFAAISTIAQLAYFMLARPAIRLLLDRAADYPTAADLDGFGRHAADFALHAVMAESTPSIVRKRRTTRKSR